VVGETYLKSTHVADGDIYTWKAHRYCSKLAETLNMYSECEEGVTMNDFMEMVSSEHGKILASQLPVHDVHKYGDIMLQLSHVKFREKLWFVIRHHKKIGKEV